MGMTGAIAVVAAGALFSANAAKKQGDNSQQVANFNAEVQNLKADDALIRGREAETKHRLATRKLIGSQRAAFAAGGAVVGEADSTATNVEADTAALSEIDALTIRSNAAREAWGYRRGADDFRMRGEIAKDEANDRAIGALLGGAGKIVSGKYGG